MKTLTFQSPISDIHLIPWVLYSGQLNTPSQPYRNDRCKSHGLANWTFSERKTDLYKSFFFFMNWITVIKSQFHYDDDYSQHHINKQSSQKSQFNQNLLDFLSGDYNNTDIHYFHCPKIKFPYIYASKTQLFLSK